MDAQTNSATMKIVCISDTHAQHHLIEVPDGDILIHAGDITRHGSLDDVESFNRWLGTLPHRHKVVICGNHDFCFQNQPTEARARITNAIYLEDSGCEIEGLTFYGSPWQPWFGGWAFNLARGEALAAKWAYIPVGVDVLITHGPPEGILDKTMRGDFVGCRDLLSRVLEVKPRLHVFGHIHEAAGQLTIEDTIFVNASAEPRVGTGIVVELSL
ncbi:MAG TPA: metallophosphatase domain-containing protein [Gemmata sp.]|jgi:predicted phosphohydrolase|nr:metallophosphatase domain-containing protein [Gemmata sp.]